MGIKLPLVTRRSLVWGAIVGLIFLLGCEFAQAQTTDATGEILQRLLQGRSGAEQLGIGQPGVTDQRAPPVQIYQPALPPMVQIAPPSRLETLYSSRAGRTLAQFGYDVLGVPTAVTAAQTGGVQDNYILGEGDEIVFDLRGQENITYRQRVDRNGQIVLPKLNPMSAAGRSLGEFRADAERQVAQAYVSTNVFISVAQIRQISVLVTGEVRSPGTRILSGLATPLDAVLLSGGVAKTGSLRNVSLIRNNQVILIDLYSLLLQGTLPNIGGLRNGDRLYIPPLHNTIAVTGSVRRPGIYELREGQNSLDVTDLVQLAGGFEIGGSYRLSKSSLEADGSTRLISFSQGPVLNGEILFVDTATDVALERVNLGGAVRLPGTYPRTATATIAQLIHSSDELAPDAYTSFGVIARRDPKLNVRSLVPFSFVQVSSGGTDVPLQNDDLVYIFSRNQIRLLADLAATQQVARLRPTPYGIAPGAGSTMNRDDLTNSASSYNSDRGAPSLNSGTTPPPRSLPGASVTPGNLSSANQGNLPYGAPYGAIGSPYAPGSSVVPYGSLTTPYGSMSLPYGSTSLPYGSLPYGSASVPFGCTSVPSYGPTSVPPGLTSVPYGFTSGTTMSPGSNPFLTPGITFGGLNPQQQLYPGGAGNQQAIVPNEQNPFFAQNSLCAQQTRAEQIQPLTPASIAFVLGVPLETLFGTISDHLVWVLDEVRDPGAYVASDGATVFEMIQTAGGTLRQADLSSVEITSTEINPQSGTSRTIRTAYKGEVNDFQRVSLRPFDVIRFRPVFSDREAGRIEVAGQVRYPGTFDVLRGERLSSVLDRAGGMTETAYPYGAVFTRERAALAEREGRVREAREIRAQIASLASSPNANDRDRVSFLTSLSQQVENEPVLGRITITADPAILRVRPELDIILEPGDSLFIPPRPSTITVTGEVLNPGSFQYRAGLDVHDYITQAGSVTKGADDDRIFVVLPDGTARPVQESWLTFTSSNMLPPGSTIVVPRDLRPFDLTTFLRDATQIMSQLAVTAASLVVIGK